VANVNPVLGVVGIHRLHLAHPDLKGRVTETAKILAGFATLF
jgi:hypothetical protein